MRWNSIALLIVGPKECLGDSLTFALSVFALTMTAGILAMVPLQYLGISGDALIWSGAVAAWLAAAAMYWCEEGLFRFPQVFFFGIGASLMFFSGLVLRSSHPIVDGFDFYWLWLFVPGFYMVARVISLGLQRRPESAQKV